MEGEPHGVLLTGERACPLPLPLLVLDLWRGSKCCSVGDVVGVANSDSTGDGLGGTGAGFSEPGRALGALLFVLVALVVADS